MRMSLPALLAAPLAALAMLSSPGAHADDQPPTCLSGQVVVGSDPVTNAAATHRSVQLTFELASYSPPCVVAGYPGVDTREGWPTISATRTPRGYMGGLPGSSDAPPFVTLTREHSAYAVLEGDAVDAYGNSCPTYTSLRVTPPDNTDTQNVWATISACELQIHPVTASPSS